MLGSVDGFLPRLRIQNLNFGLRRIRISSLLLSSPHHSTTSIVTSKSSFLYIFLAFIIAFLALPCTSLQLYINPYLIPSLLILGLSVVVCCLKLAQFRKRSGSSSRDNNGGGLCANCGSKAQSLQPKGGKGGNDTEREREVIKELRRKLRRERRKRKGAREELEREREAAAWASEEAMAKIMVLQSDKAAAEREARQLREAAEQRELHDKEVIEYLQLLLHSVSMEKNGGGDTESSEVL